MTSPTRPRVALLGLGIMGSGMAQRLLRAGFPLTVYNRSAAKAASLASAGAIVAPTPAAAARNADIILSMVADDAAARAVWLGEHGALAATLKGAVCIECSTVTPAWVRELASAATGRGAEFIDAPVTGSRLQAAAGELNFLVGGAVETLDRVRPVLSAMSKSIVRLGPVGSGATVKLINNFVCGVQIAALAEAVAMIERSGLDRTAALEVLTAGSPGSPLVKAVAARMSGSDYTPNFLLQLMAKDLRYAIHEARQRSLEIETAMTALQAFERGIAAGHGEKDMAAVVEVLRG